MAKQLGLKGKTKKILTDNGYTVKSKTTEGIEIAIWRYKIVLNLNGQGNAQEITQLLLDNGILEREMWATR